MSALTRIETPKGAETSEIRELRDFIPLIHSAMTEQQISQRKLALKTGINKTRLGLLLHRDPTKRATLSIIEFQQILAALDINLLQAVITVATYPDLTLFHEVRFATSIAMLTELFMGLPALLVAALDQIEGIDGTEVRKEWAIPLRHAVVERLVKEVSAVMARRDSLSHTLSFGL